MDKLEKVERLRASAQVTYEEALSALDASDGDLLDAMVLLEKQGKTAKPGQGVYSTSYQEQKAYIDVPDQVEQQKKDAPSLGKSLRALFHTVIRFIKHTSFRITRHEKDLLRMPSWVMAVAVLIFWKELIPVALVAMLFGIRYSFENSQGTENTDAANDILAKAGEFADDVKKEIRNGLKEKKNDA